MSDKISLAGKTPTAEEILLELPLYRPLSLSEESALQISRLAGFDQSIDSFCVQCKQHSIFWGEGEQNDILSQGVYLRIPNMTRHIIRDRNFVVALKCSRIPEHHMLFYFRVHDLTLVKVGQYPSIADLQLKGLEKYRQALGKETYKEFTKAVGLFAHGVGIGSFVYLRRIFENLVNEAYERARQGSSWDEAAYQRARMDEKIALLRGFLPQVLIDNAGMYSILSRGVHALSEDDCLKYFNTVKMGIELVLDEKIASEERRKKLKSVTDEISRIKGGLG